MGHFSHHRKKTACSSQDSFAYNESHHDSYPQFPRSPLGTPGSMAPFFATDRRKKIACSLALLKQARLQKKTLAVLYSCSAKASTTNKICDTYLGMTAFDKARNTQCSGTFRNVKKNFFFVKKKKIIIINSLQKIIITK